MIVSIPRDATGTRAGLVQEMQQARAHTDSLFKVVRREAVYERPIPERRRLLFYLGHLEAFDWNQIGQTAGAGACDADLDRLFAFGIDPPLGLPPQDRPEDWPSIERTEEYRACVREALQPLLQAAPEETLQMALEHRWMHAETFAYLLQHLDYSQKERPKGPSPEFDGGRPLDEGAPIEVAGGWATLGKRRGEGFGWDNEFDEHRVWVDAFRLGRYKVTNGQYLEYVSRGGSVPPGWVERGGRWYLRGMFEEVLLPLSWPVYTTRAQALAYAAWKGAHLPSEAQLHRAGWGTPGGEEREYPWGDTFSSECGNFGFQGYDPVPVDATPRGDSAWGVSQILGNGWEWTDTPFGPFQGFRAHPSYPGYSADFFDGDHYTVKGASSQTAERLLRRSFRSWFRSAYPYAYTGFRLVWR